MSRPIAALYVESEGAYIGVPGVDPWDEARDARKYAGPHPIVAHPLCQRWGRFWHGSTAKPHQFEKGADGGCFEAAIQAVWAFGGVIEHPADSHAWERFNIPRPPRVGGWVSVWRENEIRRMDMGPGGAAVERALAERHDTEWTCEVSQGHYGHFAGKRTWLLASGIRHCDLPELIWGPCEQRIHPLALAKHGYAKARRIGMMAMVGGKDKTRIRNATPPEFREVLLSIARKASA